MILDPQAIALTVLVASLAMAAALLVSAGRQPVEIGVAQRHWARGLVLGPTGWLLLEWAHQPALLVLAVPGKVLIMAAFVEYLRAALAFRGASVRHPAWLVPALMVGVLTAIAVLRAPDQPMRTSLLAAICAGVATIAAVALARTARERSRAHVTLVVVSLALAAIALGTQAAWQLLPIGTPPAWDTRPFAHTVLLGTGVLAPAVATLGFVLMGSDRLLDRLAALAATDALTGASTRQAFVASASARLAALEDRGHHHALLVVDVDHFKAVNDAWGHETGDHALRRVADALRHALRPGDLLGRWGGEEFAVLLPRTGAEVASDVANRLRDAVAAVRFEIDGRVLPLRISVGVTLWRGPGDDLGAMLRRADAAMYVAKRAGRDRVHLHAV